MTTGKGKAPGDRGFTLLETMVAVSIIAIVLVSIYRMHNQTMAMNLDARFMAMAPMLAQKAIAGIETARRDALLTTSGDFGESFPGYSWNAEIEDVTPENLGENIKGLKRIDLTVAYNADERIYRMRTYRFMPEGR